MNSLVSYAIYLLRYIDNFYIFPLKKKNMPYKHYHAVPVQNWFNKLGTMQENDPMLRKFSNIHKLRFLLKTFQNPNQYWSDTLYTSVIKIITVFNKSSIYTMQTFREQYCRMQLTVQCEQSVVSVSWERSEIWTESGASVNRFSFLKSSALTRSLLISCIYKIFCLYNPQ